MKLKRLIFEEQDLVPESIQLIEDIVNGVQLSSNDIVISKSLEQFKNRDREYVVELSYGPTDLKSVIYFDTKVDGEWGIEVRAPENLKLYSDEDFIEFDSFEDLKEKAIKYILGQLRRYIDISVLKKQKHDITLDFQEEMKKKLKELGYDIQRIFVSQKQKKPITRLNFTVRGRNGGRLISLEIIEYPKDETTMITGTFNVISDLAPIYGLESYNLAYYSYNIKEIIQKIGERISQIEEDFTTGED